MIFGDFFEYLKSFCRVQVLGEFFGSFEGSWTVLANLKQLSCCAVAFRSCWLIKKGSANGGDLCGSPYQSICLGIATALKKQGPPVSGMPVLQVTRIAFTFRKNLNCMFIAKVGSAIQFKRFKAYSLLPTTAMKEVTPTETRVGWIGTGVMGQAMCGHLLDAGYHVTVFNRTPNKAEGLCKRGAVLVDSPQAVAQKSDVVFTIVGYPTDVRQVILGQVGILQGLKAGGIVVDMTTSEPSLAREIYSVFKEKGCSSIDAPVSGGDRGAKLGTLSIMVGGDEDIAQSLAPLFKCMGTPTYLGPAGTGQSCKLANQITIASTMVGMVEGMLYAHKAGLDISVYLQAISGGAAGCRSLDLYAARIQKRDFNPGFFVNHFVKDLGIALEECRQTGLSLPGLALAQQLYVSLKGHGEGNLGIQALVLALERLNNLELPKLSHKEC